MHHNDGLVAQISETRDRARTRRRPSGRAGTTVALGVGRRDRDGADHRVGRRGRSDRTDRFVGRARDPRGSSRRAPRQPCSASSTMAAGLDARPRRVARARLVVAAAAPSLRPLNRIACIWAAPLLIGPPIFSRDLYSYAADGLMVHRHISPVRVRAGRARRVEVPRARESRVADHAFALRAALLAARARSPCASRAEAS